MKMLSASLMIIALTSASAIAKEPATTAPTAQREILYGTLWMQTAPEYQANARQAFKLAEQLLEAAIKNKGTASLEQARLGGYQNLPPAVVVDLDETMLDNSAYQAYQLKYGATWSAPSWAEWMALEEATAVPGALAFAQTVETLRKKHPKLTIFYVSNRECNKDGSCPALRQTINNMRKLGFPSVEPSQFKLRFQRPGWEGNKVSRREDVSKSHRIVMLIGDDMKDFIAATDYDLLHAGDTAVGKHVEENLARRWVILPNPLYGSWEKALPKTLDDKYASLKPACLPAPATAQTPVADKVAGQ